MRVGAASIDITPPAGLAMAGFAARTEPALGAHDPLTIRAIAVGDTALVCADVIGLTAATTERVRARCGLPASHIVLAALHTHGGPGSMPGRIGGAVDAAFLARLEDACVDAVQQAIAHQRPARLMFGSGADPGVARNRRHPGGPTDPAVPVLAFQDDAGAWIAVVTAHACHPVVLGADNRLWTADYPAVVRRQIEAAFPGALALFLTGATGDANTGHSAHASISLAAQADRSFAAAERVGLAVAASAIAAPRQDRTGPVAAAESAIALRFARREDQPLTVLAQQWRAAATCADRARATLLRIWANWAETVGDRDVSHDTLATRVTALRWGGVTLLGLPGEIFARTALDLRAARRENLVIFGYAYDNPGYIPPRGEYAFGGYEVEEAHRYYGLPATFAPGSAEHLSETALQVLDRLNPRSDA